MTSDKMDQHYQQQLSALIDGDLPADEARFLLRRLQHDIELSGRWERWQLCGDVLRGQARAPAPTGFAERVAAGIAQSDASAGAGEAVTGAGKRLRRWGGGALAASVAMVALFMVRQQVPEQAPAVASAPASRPTAASPAATPVAVATQTAAQAAVASVASVAVASAPRRQDSSARRSATRTQQAASRSIAAARVPERGVAMVASAAVPVVHAIANATPANAAPAARDPFSNVQINPPQARPWPRAVLPQYPTGSGAFNAGFSSDRATRTFYPFEPRSMDMPPVRLPEPALRD